MIKTLETPKMFNFDQPKLKLGVAYTRRDTWMNKETETVYNPVYSPS